MPDYYPFRILFFASLLEGGGTAARRDGGSILRFIHKLTAMPLSRREYYNGKSLSSCQEGKGVVRGGFIGKFFCSADLMALGLEEGWVVLRAFVWGYFFRSCPAASFAAAWGFFERLRRFGVFRCLRAATRGSAPWTPQPLKRLAKLLCLSLCDWRIKLRSAVTEKSPAETHFMYAVKIKFSSDDTLAFTVGAFNNLACFVRDKGAAVEGQG